MWLVLTLAIFVVVHFGMEHRIPKLGITVSDKKILKSFLHIFLNIQAIGLYFVILDFLNVHFQLT